jgi:hypothetical protein
MPTLNSLFGSNLSAALNELLRDAEQIRALISNPEWKRTLSGTSEKNEVLLSRLVFDLLQANDHLLKTKEHLAEIVSPQKQVQSA